MNPQILAKTETWKILGVIFTGIVAAVSICQWRYKSMEQDHMRLNDANQLPIASYHKPGDTVTAKVIHIKQDQAGFTHKKAQMHNRNRDSIPTVYGRYVTFQLSQYKEVPVYVSFYFDSREHETLESLFKDYKKKDRPLYLKIDDEYQVTPALISEQ